MFYKMFSGIHDGGIVIAPGDIEIHILFYVGYVIQGVSQRKNALVFGAEGGGKIAAANNGFHIGSLADFLDHRNAGKGIHIQVDIGKEKEGCAVLDLRPGGIVAGDHILNVRLVKIRVSHKITSACNK